MANQFKVYDLIASDITTNNINSSNINSSNININNITSNNEYLTVNPDIVFSGNSLTAPNQIITSSSSILTKELADFLYAGETFYISIKNNESQRVYNNTTGEEVHSFTLPIGTWDFESCWLITGMPISGGQAYRCWHTINNNNYIFYGQGIRHFPLAENFATPQLKIEHATSESQILTSTVSLQRRYWFYNQGTFILNEPTKISITLATAQTPQDALWLLPGAMLKAKRVG